MKTKLIILSAFSVVLFSCTDSHTPSKERLEKISKIRLPATFQVLIDDFQDMGQDYAVHYDLKFDTPSIIKLRENIRNSRLYRTNGSSAIYSDSLMNAKPTDFSIWYPVTKGYEFKGKDGAVLYSIIIDTTRNFLKYYEYVL